MKNSNNSELGTFENDNNQTETKLLRSHNEDRGLGDVSFLDKYGQVCSLQDSSSAEEPCIWLGVDNTGDYIDGPNGKRNEQVSVRMHLTKAMVAQILPYLLEFVASEKYISNINDRDVNAHAKLLEMLQAHDAGQFGYKLGEKVKASSEFTSEQDKEMTVVGLPVVDDQNMMWTPVRDPEVEDTLTYFKSHCLVPDNRKS